MEWGIGFIPRLKGAGILLAFYNETSPRWTQARRRPGGIPSPSTARRGRSPTAIRRRDTAAPTRTASWGRPRSSSPGNEFETAGIGEQSPRHDVPHERVSLASRSGTKGNGSNTFRSSCLDIEYCFGHRDEPAHDDASAETTPPNYLTACRMLHQHTIITHSSPVDVPALDAERALAIDQTS